MDVEEKEETLIPPPAQRVVADLLQCKEANITIRYMDV